MSIGEGINNYGDVVGFSTTASETGLAFLYTGHTMIALNTLLPYGSNLGLFNAYGINDNGWITGQANVNGQSHAFLLRPNAVPEPSALTLASVGAIALRMGLRRRK